MKFNDGKTEFPSGKNTPFSFSKSVALPILSLFLLITIPLYLYDPPPHFILRSLATKTNDSIPIHAKTTTINDSISLFQDNESVSPPAVQSPSLNDQTPEKNNNVTNLLRLGGGCNLFKGEWVPYPEGPYYTNETTCVIDDRQNCMKFGRPDTEFLKWRWKPDECELPLFDGVQFLELLRGKTLGFVGDSVGRNQMQSLMCLLATTAYPMYFAYTPDERFERWLYADYNFTLIALWSPLLVKANQSQPQPQPQNNTLMNLYLDEADPGWTAQIENIDVLIISAGQWFFRPFLYYEQGKLIGCHKCKRNNTKDFLPFYGYKMAFRTTFNALLGIKNFKGLVLLRTFSADHFENGDYIHGGRCDRKVPFHKHERELEWYNLQFYKIQVEEFRLAEKMGKEKGLKFKLLDTTGAMFLRPDGHPNNYGHWANESKPADCVHWCLPGPVDTWNEFLLQMLKMEISA